MHIIAVGSQAPEQQSVSIMHGVALSLQQALDTQLCVGAQLPQETVPPLQLLLATAPHDSPAHAVPSSTQHWLGPAPPVPHRFPGVQVFVQGMVTPQLLLVADPHASPLHAVPSSTQHSFSVAAPAPHRSPGEQVFVHDMAAPQLLVAVPHASPSQTVPSFVSTQHSFDVAPPTPQGLVGRQVLLQVCLCPQLLRTDPHTTPWHAAALSGVQHASLKHVVFVGHVEHVTGCPQLLVFIVPPQAPLHVVAALSGVQQAPLWQTWGLTQLGLPLRPQ
jgi:hypothetical protein